MSRHGYVDDGYDDYLALGRYRGRVASAIRGKRGQAFLRELAAALDAMPVKELIAHELVDEEGQVCAIGAVCKARGLDVSHVDPEDAEGIADLVGIAHVLVREIEWENDDEWGEVLPERRWQRMRKWVDGHIVKLEVQEG